MRGFFWMVALSSLVGCGAAGADVEGSAGGITFGKTDQVYFGGPFIIISMLDVSCDQLDFVRRNYEIGQAPTETDTRILQFSFSVDTVTEGLAPVDIDASVSASTVSVQGGALSESIASGGLLTVDSVNDEDHVSGSFDGILFDDGTLSGSFDAIWCRNLKAR